MESGFKEFGPLLDFRDWLVSIRNDPERRQARRRNGHITTNEGGALIPGPFTLQARAEILERLRQVEAVTEQTLVSKEEVDFIHEIWAHEISTYSNARSMCVREIRKGK